MKQLYRKSLIRRFWTIEQPRIWTGDHHSNMDIHTVSEWGNQAEFKAFCRHRADCRKKDSQQLHKILVASSERNSILRPCSLDPNLVNVYKLRTIRISKKNFIFILLICDWRVLAYLIIDFRSSCALRMMICFIDWLWE